MMVPGAPIGSYEVVRRLGVGGMGSVYLARHRDLDRLVALKLLREEEEEDDDDGSMRGRFAREARSVARLDHPNIVRVYDFGYYQDRPYIAMEYVAGETLLQRLRSGAPLALGQILEWIEQLCHALGHAHGFDVIHRDVKPANLIISPAGVLKVLDFGIARLGAQTLTEKGALVGTLAYMSPEQVGGLPIDHRTDIFSAGLVLYELLTGQQAFKGSVRDGVVNAILNRAPTRVRQLRPSVPSAVEAVVEKAIERDRARRYQTCVEFARDLGQVREHLHGLATHDLAAPGTTVVLDSERMKKSAVPSFRGRAALAAVALLVVAVTTGVLFLRSDAGPRGAAPPPLAAPAPVDGGTEAAQPGAIATGADAPAPEMNDSPATPPVVAAQQNTGELVVDARPWASVVRVLDAAGASVAVPADAVTPLRLILPAGQYSIALRDQAGVTQTLQAQVRAARRVEVTAQFGSMSAAEYLKGIKR